MEQMSGSRLGANILKDCLCIRFRIHWPHQSVAHRRACWERWIAQLQNLPWE